VTGPVRRFLYLQVRPEGAASLRAALAGGEPCEIVRVENRSAFEGALENGWQYECFLADPRGLDSGSREACLAAARRWPGTPFLLAGKGLTDAEALPWLEEGAADCLDLDRPERLRLGVARALAEAARGRELERAEADAAWASALLRATLDATSEGILITDLAGRVATYNRQFLNHCGVPEALLAPMAAEAAIRFLGDHFEDPQALLAEMHRLAAPPGEVRSGRLQAGATFLEAASRPFSLDGRAGGQVLSFRDVSGEEAAAREGRRRRWNLQAEVARAAAARLEEPLRRIRNRLELLEASHPLTEAQRMHLAAAAQAAKGLASLAETMGGGPQGPPVAGLRLEALLVKLRPRLEALLEAGARLEMEVAGDLPALTAPPLLLEQAIVALVRNAREAMGGQGRILLRAGARAGGLFLEVLDEGPGLPPEALERLGEPFFTTRDKGRGLGLFLARTLAEACGGSLEASGREGGGLRVRLDLPG